MVSRPRPPPPPPPPASTLPPHFSFFLLSPTFRLDLWREGDFLGRREHRYTLREREGGGARTKAGVFNLQVLEAGTLRFCTVENIVKKNRTPLRYN